MNDLHIKYKQDTGKNVFIEFETKLYQESFDSRILSEHTKEEILSLIELDDDFWGLSQDDIEEKIPSSHGNGNIKLYSDKYIEWLENKINS